jgi:hypothetical protein
MKITSDKPLRIIARLALALSLAEVLGAIVLLVTGMPL